MREAKEIAKQIYAAYANGQLEGMFITDTGSIDERFKKKIEATAKQVQQEAYIAGLEKARALAEEWPILRDRNIRAEISKLITNEIEKTK